MKLSIVLAVMALALAATPASAKKKAHPAPAPAPKGWEIPKSAVKDGPWSYHYTDPQGKAWIYRQTPFGVMRFEDRKLPQADADRRIEDVKAVEDGDTIRFERPSPFGVMHWQSKKQDLNEMERAVWERELARQNAPQD